jgi:hypothetical protein
MKKRNGFVSNSSSTSYIVVLNQEANTCPHCGRSDPNLLDTIASASNLSEDTYLHVVGLDRILDHFLNKEGFMGPFEKEIIAKIKNTEIKSNEEIAYISISYHDDTIKQIFANLVSSGNAKVIWRDH